MRSRMSSDRRSSPSGPLSCRRSCPATLACSNRPTCERRRSMSMRTDMSGTSIDTLARTPMPSRVVARIWSGVTQSGAAGDPSER